MRLPRWFKGNRSLVGNRMMATVLNGLFASALSLVVWRLTGNFWGWLVLFILGGFLILKAWLVGIRGLLLGLDPEDWH